MSKPCFIRYANLDDLNQLAPLFNAYRIFYQQESNLQIAHDFLQQRLAFNESVILLASDQEGNGLGFIQLYPSFCSIAAARVWVLYDLFVDEAARGQGISRLLMEKARLHAIQTGAVRLDLSTAHSNQRAQALYESLGYKADQTYRYYSLEI
ncbi:GNAT family N-acetyltransferase [Iodobacter sp. LRB]|uniref:GNAT family N-acetyltransferase n=1 Tax=unclassified Iodobacter TaxID=235634 RepID=UPI000C0DAB9A|nr:GNAT family N-acetyltransferase [Iodobacter sp. BJB302]PHU99843.1 GNAT family N-acetyltransferase [Iodobacter sp. BJB302]